MIEGEMAVSPDAIQVISFDAGDTLFEVRGSVGEIYARIARSHGVEVPADEVQAKFILAFRSQPPLAFSGLKGEALVRAEKRWWFEIVEKVFAGRISDAGLVHYFDMVFEAFRGIEAWQLFPDTRPSLERLRGLGYRMAIISNFDSRLHDVLQALDIQEFFDPVTISSRVGAAKPDARIFRRALELMQTSPSSVLHVGDSLEEDVRGAQEAGLQAVWLDRKKVFEGQLEAQRVESLEELCNLLEV